MVMTPARSRSFLESPARLVLTAYATAIVAGTLLLLLPPAAHGDAGASFATAAFTSTSAITVTGLSVVDTSTHWTSFGQVIILVLVQLGGIGIMTLASLVVLGLSRRIGLRYRLIAQTETGVGSLGDVRRVLRGVLILSAVVELSTGLVLAVRLATAHDQSVGSASWQGFFHAVSAFNNAGFVLFPDNFARFANDPVMVLAVAVAIVLGGLGVPVLAELVLDRLHWRRWSLHTKLVVVGSVALVLAGWLLIAWFEWSNSQTLGPMSVPDKVLNGLFHSVSPRSAGFATVDYADMNETSWLVTTALMFIGAGPVSTGGGIKVTTFTLLAFVILSEARGDRDVALFGRRVAPTVERQAVSIALIGVGAVAVTTLALMALGDWSMSAVVFEVASAAGTAGLTTGITGDIPGSGQVLLGLLMLAGRIGPLTVGAALAARRRDVRIRFPEERPLIG